MMVRGAEAEEVHFEEADFFAGGAVPLGHDVVAVFVEGDDFIEGFVADDDAGGVHAGVAAEAFEAAGDGEEVLDLGGFVDHLFDVGDFDGVVEADVGAAGDELGDLVGFLDGHAQDAADVLDGGFGAQGVEGYDLADVAVLFADVFDDFAAAFLADIGIDIRHGRALGVHEAFEEQVVAEGIDVAEGQDVADEGADAGASGADGMPVVFGVVAKIPDDEEVGGEALGADDLEFVIEAFHESCELLGGELVEGAEFFGEAFEAQFAEVFLGGGGFAIDGGGGVDGGVAGVEIEFQVDLFGDFQRVVAGFGDILEDGPHLGGGLEVEFGGVFEAVFVGQGFAHGDAAQGIVGVVVFLEQKMVVVGGDDGTPARRATSRSLGSIAICSGWKWFLQFDVEIVAEDVLVLAGDGDGAFHVAFFDHAGDFGAEVAVDGDDAFVVFGEGFLIDAGAVIETLGVGEGGEFEHVLPAGVIFHDDGKMVGGLGDAMGVFVEARGGGDVEFAADDAFEVVFFGGGVPFDGAEEVAMVGEGDGGHAEFFGTFEEVVDGGTAIEEGVVGVAVEMDERVCGVGHGVLRDGRVAVYSAGSGNLKFWQAGGLFRFYTGIM